MTVATPFLSTDPRLDSACISHCRGQCQPACVGGGHCVVNVDANDRLAWRPTRADTLDWLRLHRPQALDEAVAA